MIRFFLAALSILIFTCCKNKNANVTSAAIHAATDTSNFTTVQWLDSAQNLGTLNMGGIAQIKFHFKNTGNNPLYIIDAQPGCGCTVADYPKEAIAKGQGGEIAAAFDTKKGHAGIFRKSITVHTNTKSGGNTLLFFEGEIKSKEGEEQKEPEPVQVPKKQTL